MFRFLCVLDFEATCDRGQSFTPPHEVIEFPSVMLERNEDNEYRPVAEFQEFCKPLYNIKLTEFCKNLTGITQQQVSTGDDFPKVLERHQQWLSQFSLEPEELVIVCCGRWDICEMMLNECRRWCITPHRIYMRTINVKDLFCKRFGGFRGGMKAMLEYMEIPLQGRHHSGLDDSRNIASMTSVLAGEISLDTVIQVEAKLYKMTKHEKIKAKAALSKRLEKR